MPTLVIVGGGLVGALTAITFARKGYDVTVYEKRPDIRKEAAVRGRSINLALSLRGISALKAAGIESSVVNNTIPMTGRMIHVGHSEPYPQPYGMYGESINSVDRRYLNEHLLDVAESNPNVKLVFNHALEWADFHTDHCELNDDKKVIVKCDWVVGCDGAYSSLRESMARISRMNLQREYITHGYKELRIPPVNGDFAMSPNHLHIWPRGEFMMIALPNQDFSFTCTLFWPFQVFESLVTEDQVLKFFETNFPDSVSLIGKEDLIKDFFDNPTSPLVSLKCNPYHYSDKVIILGDASHAMVPFYGQGMNCGFEDVEILSKLFDEFEGNIGKAFETFSLQRQPAASAICDLAMENFHEMSSKVVSKSFLLEKNVINFFHRLFPTCVIPLYSMVSFTQIPYDQVVERDRRQKRMLRGILKLTSVVVAGALIYFSRGKFCRLLHCHK